MQIKFLKELITSVTGNAGNEVVDLLYGKKNVNEFIIAKKLNLNINQARNILYKLSDYGIVSFVRKKDRKNGGWWTYYWTLNVLRSLEVMRDKVISEIKNLENNLHMRQNQRFYYCANCDLEMDEENSLNHDFICTECGEVLVLRDNELFVNQFKNQIEKRREQLKLIESEISQIENKNYALRKMKVAREVRKKKEQRAIKRAKIAPTKKKYLSKRKLKTKSLSKRFNSRNRKKKI